MLRIFAVAALLALSGCASIISGTSQEIAISTTPPGARCTLAREGATIADIAVTPGTAKVSRDSHAISVTCTKDGYLASTQYIDSGFEGSTLSNALTLGLITAGIGATIDAADGADNRYADSTVVALVPDSNTAPPPSQSGKFIQQSTGTTVGSATAIFVGCKLEDGEVASLTPADCSARGGVEY